VGRENYYPIGLVVVERFGTDKAAREYRSEIVYHGPTYVGTCMGEYDAVTGMGLRNDREKGIYSSIRHDRPKAAPEVVPPDPAIESQGGAA
jgi:hypothetical protein